MKLLIYQYIDMFIQIYMQYDTPVIEVVNIKPKFNHAVSKSSIDKRLMLKDIHSQTTRRDLYRAL